MRIAFFTHYADLYGANRSLLNLLDGLKPYGVVPLVIAPCLGPVTAVLAQRDVPFLVVPFEWWCSESAPVQGAAASIFARYRLRRAAIGRLRANLAAGLRLRRELRAWGADLLYSNSSVIPLGALVARMLDKPHVWHLREFGDLDYDLVPDWGRTLFHALIGNADAQVCVSQAIASHYREALSRGRGHVVYNGVASEPQIDRLREAARGGRDPGAPFVFSIIGLIHPNKGQETAIRAMAIVKAAFPQVCLLIAGADDRGGEELARVKRLAAELGVGREVSFLGYVDDPYTVYAQSDAVLMCSKSEGMGRVTVEAMTASMPVIGYDEGGTRELVQHEANGLLYRGGAAELAASMLRLVEAPELARRMGENGWRTARERYSIEACAKRVYQICCAAVTRGRQGGGNAQGACAGGNR
jgi:glycosyltransferase involved in cell wall biosynthesis